MINILFTLPFIIFLPLNSLSQDCQLEVKVFGLEKNNGQMLIAVFDNKEDFLEKDLMHSKVQVGKENYVVTCFNNLVPGIYSISVIHDIDKNEKLNTVLFGPPTEPYGFSNDAKGFLGPPSFEDTSFEIKKGEKKKIEIKLF